MRNKIETQEEINELMPNESCIPCDTKNSEMLRKEHNRWKTEIKKSQDGKSAGTSYWKNASSCSAL
ncbi:MAG: hypothetical protein ACJAT4_002740 [Granulosicoccus sp.]|jgi:hypothetical protein